MQSVRTESRVLCAGEAVRNRVRTEAGVRAGGAVLSALATRVLVCVRLRSLGGFRVIGIRPACVLALLPAVSPRAGERIDHPKSVGQRVDEVDGAAKDEGAQAPAEDRCRGAEAGVVICADRAGCSVTGRNEESESGSGMRERSPKGPVSQEAERAQCDREGKSVCGGIPVGRSSAETNPPHWQ